MSIINEFTFLTREQIFGENKLDIFEKYGVKCAITDFSILLGGVVSSVYYTSEGGILKNRTGWYWTKTPYGDKVRVNTVGEKGDDIWDFISSSFVGARPALPYSSISQISTNGVRDAKGIKILVPDSN